jgi:hypothetical protein
MVQAESIEAIVQENSKRNTILFSYYNPVTGEGSPLERKLVSYTALGNKIWYRIPLPMYEENSGLIDAINKIGSLEETLKSIGQSSDIDSVAAFNKQLIDIRYRHDFEYWAFTCAKIQDKKTKAIFPLKLNFAQRIYFARLERMRLAGIPIRIVLLKARQWGGSTLTQIYMGWIQIILKLNWHSVVVADVEEQSKNINGMYSRLAREYPSMAGIVKLVPYERSTKSRIVEGRGSVISIGSAQKPDNIRSFDLAMAHFSEVAFFKATQQKTPEDLVQSIRAAVSDVPDSLIVLESTAKGVGTFFHREWLKAKSGISGYDPVFIPWYMIERYQLAIPDLPKFIKWVKTNNYAMSLWNQGAALEGINWYFDYKTRENYDDWQMQAEYPTNDTEAFISTGARVFAPNYVKAAQKNCIPPEFVGDITARSQKGKDAFENIEFMETTKGQLSIWALPDKSEEISNRYAITVDIGGRTPDADYSVIKVFDRYFMKDGGKPEVVAVWTGHLDQDLVAWKAAQIAWFYNKGLLVVESNSLDKDELEGSEGEHFLTVLNEIVKFYKNIYARIDQERVKQGLPVRYGFHTDRSTKPMVIDELNGAIREEAYIERDERAANEMDTYEVKPNGKYGATEGTHDDHVMATAIGVWIVFKYMPTPRVIDHRGKTYTKKVVSEASI